MRERESNWSFGERESWGCRIEDEYRSLLRFLCVDLQMPHLIMMDGIDVLNECSMLPFHLRLFLSFIYFSSSMVCCPSEFGTSSSCARENEIICGSP